jgi:hypothetical protein
MNSVETLQNEHRFRTLEIHPLKGGVCMHACMLATKVISVLNRHI